MGDEEGGGESELFEQWCDDRAVGQHGIVKGENDEFLRYGRELGGSGGGDRSCRLEKTSTAYMRAAESGSHFDRDRISD